MARYNKYSEKKRQECLKRSKQLKINMLIAEAKKDKSKYYK